MDFLSTSLPPIAINLLAVILATFLIRSYAKRADTKKTKRYHPVVSNILSCLINFSRIYDFITEFLYTNKTARSLNLFRYDVFTTDPANIEYIFKTNFANYGKGLDHIILSDVFGDGFFIVDGEKWLHQRKVSTNELTTKVVRDFSNEVFKTNAVTLARVISQAATCDQAIDIQDLLKKASLDSTVKILLGIDLDTMHGTNEEGTKFSHAFDEANELAFYRFVDIFWKIKRLLNIGSESKLRNDIKVIDDFVYKLIKSKIETVSNSEDDELPSKKGDIVSSLLKSRENDPKYVRDLILSLIVAGRDTTASTLSWFFYLLCKHPHIQEKIAQEVRQATNLKENSSFDEVAASLTEEALGRMQYLHAALSETLRLYPAIPLNAKTCLSDDTWPDGFSVKKGDMVGYTGYSMGRMKYVWGDDAEEFRPERWLDENGLFQQQSPFKFPAFNSGPRICVGKDLAYRQMKIFSAVLVSSFIFKLSNKNEVANYSVKLSLHIDGGLYVQASPRLGHA